MAKFARSQHCTDCVDCNRKLPLFQLLSGEELETMNRNRFEVRFKVGETIFKQGTSATHLLVITSGLAKLYVEGVQDRQLIIRIIRPWELVGHAGLYYDSRHHYSIAALDEVTACFIGIEEFKASLRSNAEFAEEFIKAYTSKGIFSYEKMVSLSQKQMHGRIADGLLYLSHNVYGDSSFNMHLSRQDLADLTGMSKDSAIRILKEFHHEGVIELKGRKLTILNPDQLEHISETG
ncbi:MAG: Crp/Fnr family transcriptional regulator [Marinifilaceae bacterium]